MGNLVNYFLTSKNSRLINGHLPSENLKEKILNHDGGEAYCCYFDLDENLLKVEYDTHTRDRDGKIIYEYFNQGDTPDNADWTCNGKTFTQYEGFASPALDLISFDFDSENIQQSMDDVKSFIKWLDTDNLAIFFSGSKGFHVMIPTCLFNLTAGEHLPNKLKDLAKYLVQFYPTIDTSIYNYNRKFRVPFTLHEKTKLYKTYIAAEYFECATVEMITEMAKTRSIVNFWEMLDFEDDALGNLVFAIKESSRNSYEVEKEKGGSLEQPTAFEKFDDKLCIKKMLDSRCDDIGRNNAALRIINDYYRTGKTQEKCERDLMDWSKVNGLPVREVLAIISNIYNQRQNYNFGCQDECKSSYCSAKCSIWKKLDPDKRPITVDMPESAIAEQRKAKQPSEFDVVKKVLVDVLHCHWDETYRKFSGGLICKQGKDDLFLYNNGYWEHLTEERVDNIKIKFNALYDNILTTRRIDAIFKMFLLYVPSKPAHVDMFIPKSNVANFSNGTLHLKIDLEGNFKFEFKEHNREDYITFKIDYDYDQSFLEVNSKFEDWLLEYVNDDQEQFNLVQEMFGASLMPAFPQFFVLLGPAGTGKSTCIKILKMIHKYKDDTKENERNISKVPPHQFNGKNMTTMIGRLVNIVMDIKTNARIDDDIIKQVEDRDSIRIERKFKDDVYAPLPALHIFGANDMPRTMEGYSGAMNRRWSIISFNKVYKGKRNRNIASVLFNENAQGVINFAVKGLIRLALENQGFFSKSSKSAERVQEWTSQDDIMELFVDDGSYEGFELDGNIVKFERHDEARFERNKLWNIFNNWQVEALARNDQIGRNSFYKMMKVKGFDVKKFEGMRYFVGIGELNKEQLSNDNI